MSRHKILFVDVGTYATKLTMQCENQAFDNNLSRRDRKKEIAKCVNKVINRMENIYSKEGFIVKENKYFSKGILLYETIDNELELFKELNNEMMKTMLNYTGIEINNTFHKSRGLIINKLSKSSNEKLFYVVNEVNESIYNYPAQIKFPKNTKKLLKMRIKDNQLIFQSVFCGDTDTYRIIDEREFRGFYFVYEYMKYNYLWNKFRSKLLEKYFKLVEVDDDDDLETLYDYHLYYDISYRDDIINANESDSDNELNDEKSKTEEDIRNEIINDKIKNDLNIKGYSIFTIEYKYNNYETNIIYKWKSRAKDFNDILFKKEFIPLLEKFDKSFKYNYNFYYLNMQNIKRKKLINYNPAYDEDGADHLLMNPVFKPNGHLYSIPSNIKEYNFKLPITNIIVLDMIEKNIFKLKNRIKIIKFIHVLYNKFNSISNRNILTINIINKILSYIN